MTIEKYLVKHNNCIDIAMDIFDLQNLTLKVKILNTQVPKDISEQALIKVIENIKKSIDNN